eukprot:RCo041966
MSRSLRDSPPRAMSKARSRSDKTPQTPRCCGCKERDVQIDALRNENHALLLEVEELRARAMQLTEALQGQETDVKTLLSQDEHLKAENDQLKAQTAELLQELERTKAQLLGCQGSPDVGCCHSPSIQLQLQEISRERNEFAAANRQLAEELAELQRLLQDQTSSRAMEAETNARLKVQLQELQSLRCNAERQLREYGSPSRRSLPSHSPCCASPSVADPGCILLKQKIRELELQANKSTNALAEKDAELVHLRELLRTFSTAALHWEGRSAEKEGCAGEGGERECSRISDSCPGSKSPGMGSKPLSTKAVLLPQLQRVLESMGGENNILIAENVRLLHENGQLSTLVHELTSQVASLQVFRDEAREVQQRLEAEKGNTIRLKSLEAELSAAHLSISELGTELSTARKEVSQLQYDTAHREQLASSLQARLVEADGELRLTLEKLNNATRAASGEAQKQNAIFVELKSQLISHVTCFHEELKQVLCQLAGLVPRLSDSLEKYALVGARASIDQALHIAHGFLRCIQGLSTEMFYTGEEDVVSRGLLQQVAVSEQRCSQHAAENCRLIEALKSTDRKVTEASEHLNCLQSENLSLRSMVQQSGQEVLSLRAYAGRTEIANNQLETTVGLLSGENGFLKAQYQQLLCSSQDTRYQEAFRLQQEISGMANTIRQTQLQVQERDLTIQNLKHQIDQLTEEAAKVRAEFVAVRGTCSTETARLLEEIMTCRTELQQARSGQEVKSGEVIRLQQEISTLQGGFAEKQLLLQNLDLASEKLKQDRERCLEESIKLQAQLSSVVSSAEVESFRLKSELKASALQVERLSQCQRDAEKEVVRVQQELTSALISVKDRDSEIAALKLERDRCSNESAKLHGELSSLRGSLVENERLKDEIRACADQLEQAREEESAEAIRLQNEIVRLTSEIRDAQVQLQTREKAYDMLQRDLELCREESDKLRVEVQTVRSAASTEASSLKSELKACVVQLERLTLEGQGKRDEVIRMQQEMSSLSLSVQERDLVLQKLKQSRDQGFEDSAKLRAELAAVRGTTLTENARLKEELKACALQLEQARKGQQDKTGEVIRLTQEISSLRTGIQEAELFARNRDVQYDQVEQSSRRCLEDCAKLQAEIASARSSANAETIQLKNELDACVIQLEQATKLYHEKYEEAFRMQEEMSAIRTTLQDREATFSALLQERDSLLEQLTQLQGELVRVRDAAFVETGQQKEEIKGFMHQLEQVTRALAELHSQCSQTGWRGQRAAQDPHLLEMQAGIRSLSEQLQRSRDELAARIADNTNVSVQVQTTPCQVAVFDERQYQQVPESARRSMKEQELGYLREQLNLTRAELHAARGQKNFYLQEGSSRVTARPPQLHRPMDTRDSVSFGTGRVVEIVRPVEPGTR